MQLGDWLSQNLREPLFLRLLYIFFSGATSILTSFSFLDITLRYSVVKHSVDEIFRCTFGTCTYVNKSRYGLLGHQERCRYNGVRDAKRQGNKFASKQKRQFDMTSDPINYLSFSFDHLERDMDDGNGCESVKSMAGVPNYMLRYGRASTSVKY